MVEAPEKIAPWRSKFDLQCGPLESSTNLRFEAANKRWICLKNSFEYTKK
jgi:hypothetical protein